MAVGVVVAAVIVVVVVIIQTVRARRCGTGSDSIGCTAPTVARISRLSDGPVDQRLGAPDSRADLQSGDPLLDAKAEFLLPPDSPDRRGNHRRAYHEILRPREIRHLHHGGQMRHQEPDWQRRGLLPRSRLKLRCHARPPSPAAVRDDAGLWKKIQRRQGLSNRRVMEEVCSP